MKIWKCSNCGSMRKKSEGGLFDRSNGEPEVCEYCNTVMTVVSSVDEFDIDSKGVLIQYNGKGGDVVVPDGVVRIGYYAFNENERVTSVKLPDSVTEIEKCAFDGCTELEEINLPQNIGSIGPYAFEGCASLKKIEIPDSVLTINLRTFKNCKKLSSVKLPDSLLHIQNNVFEACESLESIFFPERLKTLGKYAFNGCSSLKEAIFKGDSLECIEDYTFSECKKLQKISLPKSLKTIGRNCFSSCESIESIGLPDTLETISESVFSNCISLKNITLPEGLCELGSKAFQGCSKLEKIHIPAKIKTINNSTFDRCANLKTVTFSEGLESIESFAFAHTALTDTLEFPDSLSNLNISAFDFPKLDKLIIGEIVERQNLTLYKFCEIKELVIKGSPKKLSTGNYESCRQIKKLTLPDSVEVIEHNAFEYFEKLEEVKLPASLKIVEEKAFYECLSLTNIVLPEGCEVLEEKAFFNYYKKFNKRTIRLPSSIKKIGKDALLADEATTIIHSSDNHVVVDYCDNAPEDTYILKTPENEKALKAKEATLHKEFEKNVKARFAHLERENKRLATVIKAHNDKIKSLKEQIESDKEAQRDLQTEKAQYKGFFKRGKRKRCDEKIIELDDSIKKAESKLNSLPKKIEKEKKELLEINNELKRYEGIDEISTEQILDIWYNIALEKYREKNYNEALDFAVRIYEFDYKDTEALYVLAKFLGDCKVSVYNDTYPLLEKAMKHGIDDNRLQADCRAQMNKIEEHWRTHRVDTEALVAALMQRERDAKATEEKAKKDFDEMWWNNHHTNL